MWVNSAYCNGDADGIECSMTMMMMVMMIIIIIIKKLRAIQKKTKISTGNVQLTPQLRPVHLVVNGDKTSVCLSTGRHLIRKVCGS